MGFIRAGTLLACMVASAATGLATAGDAGRPPATFDIKAETAAVPDGAGFRAVFSSRVYSLGDYYYRFVLYTAQLDGRCQACRTSIDGAVYRQYGDAWQRVGWSPNLVDLPPGLRDPAVQEVDMGAGHAGAVLRLTDRRGIRQDAPTAILAVDGDIMRLAWGGMANQVSWTDDPGLSWKQLWIERDDRQDRRTLYRWVGTGYTPRPATPEDRPIFIAGTEIYPPQRRKRVGGTAIVTAFVDERGLVTDMQLTHPSGYADIDKNALDSIRRWVFWPAMRYGKPVAGSLRIPITQGRPSLPETWGPLTDPKPTDWRNQTAAAIPASPASSPAVAMNTTAPEAFDDGAGLPAAMICALLRRPDYYAGKRIALKGYVTDRAGVQRLGADDNCPLKISLDLAYVDHGANGYKFDQLRHAVAEGGGRGLVVVVGRFDRSAKAESIGTFTVEDVRTAFPAALTTGSH